MKFRIIAVISSLAPSFTQASFLWGPQKAAANTPMKRGNSTSIVEKRIVTELSTCGYLTGDPSKARTANPGYNCRVDTSHGLWGFCPTTVISAVDCGLGGACVDSYACSNGCGYTNNPKMTTWICSESTEAFCSTALLAFGIDQTYSYIGCGRTATTDHYFASPTAAAVVATSSPVSTSLSPLPKQTSMASASSISTASSVWGSNMSPASSSPPSAADARTTAAVAATTTTSQIPSDPGSNKSGGSSSDIGPIIGGVIGGLMVICASVVLAIYLVKRDRLGKERKAAAASAGASVPPGYTLPKDLDSHGRYDGWGPRELPGHHPVEQIRSPVELPGHAL